MDGISSAASVIAIIQLAGSLVTICGGYIQKVKHAREDIITLRWAAQSLQVTLQDLLRLLEDSNNTRLPTSLRLASDITNCLSDLRALNEKLESNVGKRSMKKFGFRAWRWPLERADVDSEVQKFERYKSSFLLSLQVDQTASELSSGVQKALRDDPEIASKSLGEQFDKLLLQPLLKLDQLGQEPQTAVIVIDALDECDHDQDIRNIIRLLPLLKRANTLRLRIFLTSRPELPIRLGFSGIENDNYEQLALHEVSEKVTERDIYLFLKDQLIRIKHDRNITRDWPGEDVIQKLVTMSVPLFISAATVCRFIENSRWEPASRLAELLEDQAKYATKMDKTYLPILTRLLDDQDSDDLEQQQLLYEFQEIVGVITLLAVPLSINALSLFLGIQADQISNRLDSFRSVLSVPTDRDMPVADKAPLQIYCAGLVFTPLEAMVRREFQKELPSWVCQLPRVEDRWSAELQALEGHSAPVWSVAFSPNGRLLASGSFDRTVCLWETETGVLKQTLEGHLAHVWSVAFSPNGRLLASGSDDSNVHIWDSATGALQRTLRGHTKSVRSVAFSANNRLLASGSEDKTVHLWDLATGSLHQTLKGHSQLVWSVNISADSLLLASGSEDKTVCLWDLTTGRLLQTLKGHLDVVFSVGFSPDGRLLASGSGDKTVRLWNTTTGATQRILEGHSDWVLSVAFSPDGRLLASGSADKTLRLWDTMGGTLQQTLGNDSGLVPSVTFSPDGRRLASASDKSLLRLWDTTVGAPRQTLVGHSEWIQSIVFSPDGCLLASGSNDRTVRLWDPLTGTLQQTLKGHSAPVSSVAFSPDGMLLASCSPDRTVCLWDLTKGRLQHTLRGHSSWVRLVSFSPDGRLLASGSEDQTVCLWDSATGLLLQTLKGHLDSVLSATFSPDSRLLASGSRDHTVCLWDSATGTLQQTLKGHGKLVRLLAFSPDGRLLASASADETVRIWDTATGALQQTNFTATLSTLEFSSDSSYLYTDLGALDLQFKCHIPVPRPLASF
ncbi:hypothetical protein CNMCM5878_002845 [Aspergillus fumigatiaffinis]|nr:hypothetical protein CNMCM5878_002845 [Aspergillus fumigatiaffinis]